MGSTSKIVHHVINYNCTKFGAFTTKPTILIKFWTNLPDYFGSFSRRRICYVIFFAQPISCFPSLGVSGGIFKVAGTGFQKHRSVRMSHNQRLRNTRCVKRLLQVFEVIFFRNVRAMDFRALVQWLKLIVKIFALVANLRFDIVGASREGTEFLLG